MNEQEEMSFEWMIRKMVAYEPGERATMTEVIELISDSHWVDTQLAHSVFVFLQTGEALLDQRQYMLTMSPYSCKSISIVGAHMKCCKNTRICMLFCWNIEALHARPSLLTLFKCSSPHRRSMI